MSDVFLKHPEDIMKAPTRPQDTRALNIGVMGYYGFGNLGDEMLLSAIRRFLAPHRVVAFPFSTLPTQDALDRLNGFEYLILGGGGLFNRTPGAPFDTFDQWASQLRPPISVLGLGVEQLDVQYVPAIHCLVEKSDHFIVRDAESKRLIGHPKVQVAPDLTFYQPLPRAEVRPLAPEVTCGINLRPLHRGVETWIDAIAALPCRKHALPFSLVPTYDDREPLAQLVGAWPEQTSLDAFEQLDVVIGTAFHAIVFAIQAGIPAVAINYHPKVRRLMEEVGLADYVLEWNEPQRLPACFEQAMAEQDSIRARMASYTDSAHAKLTAILSEVRSTIDEKASRPAIDRTSVGAAPRVTVFVLCHNAKRDDIAQTVASCRAQTYPEVEIVLVECPAGVDLQEIAPPADAEAERQISSARNEREIASLFAMAGDYVTWVAAGVWFAEDALALLLKNLEGRPDISLAHSDYFITYNGNIDRKISLRPSRPAKSLPLGPSFLAQRQFAAELWHVYAGEPTGDIALEQQAVHLSQPLLYRKATDCERHLYLSAIAYGRGRVDEGKKLLSEAIEIDPALTQSAAEFEQAFHGFLDAGFNRLVASDPVAYLVEICAALPAATPKQRLFARKFTGRAYLELAFLHFNQSARRKTRDSLLTAFWHDQSLLSNRGAVRLFAESLIGRKTLAKLRRNRSPQGHDS